MAGACQSLAIELGGKSEEVIVIHDCALAKITRFNCKDSKQYKQYFLSAARCNRKYLQIKVAIARDDTSSFALIPLAQRRSWH
jgi:hypothetical protein